MKKTNKASVRNYLSASYIFRGGLLPFPASAKGGTLHACRNSENTKSTQIIFTFPFLFFLLYLLLTFYSKEATAQVDPSISWRVLNTEHFEVIYAEPMKELAEIYAFEGEKSYRDLQPVFGEMTEKTIVVILDNTDLTNGYANFLPYPHMVLFPVLPGDLTTINYFDDWARDLMIHEYTHILSFQPSHSFYTPLRWIFGTIVRPNAVLPRWFLEGIAVQVESRYTRKGRLKNPATMGALRAMVKDDTLKNQDLASINETAIPSYPFGRRPYLFGSLLWQEMLENSEPGLIERLHQRQSRRLPFFLNTPIQDETGKTYTQLLQNQMSKITEKAQRQIHYLQSAGEFQGVPFSKTDGDTHVSPKISPDGRHLVFINYDAKKGTRVQLLSKSENASISFKDLEGKTLFVSSGTQKFDWFPDSKNFVYEKVDRWNRYYYFSDLYSYNINSEKTERLTHGARAREPSISPDGSFVAFVGLDNSKTSLSILRMSNKNIYHIFQPSHFNRISSPVWLNNSTLAFVGRNKKGIQGLYKFTLTDLGDHISIKSKKPHRLLSKFTHISQPVLTPSGLLFTSHQSGVANLYLAPKPFDRAWPVTNSLTHILNADMDPQTKEIVFSQSTGTGPKLHIINNQKPVAIKRLTASVSSSLKPLGPISSLKKEDIKIEDESFWGIEYLLPRYWIPFVFPIEGGAIFQGSVTGNDPLNINSYYLNGSFDTVTEKFSYATGYFYQTWGLGLDYAEFQNYLPGTSTTLTNRFGSASFNFFLPFLSYKWRGYISYIYDETEDENRVLKGAGPSAGFSYSGSDQDINATEVTSGSSLVSVNHTQYLEQDDYYSFGKTRVHLYKSTNWLLPKTHSLGLHIKGSHSPLMNFSDVVLLGDKTVGGNYLVNIINSSYIMRGYPTAAFVGRSLYNTNLEYKFPMNDIYKGNGLFPLFFKNITTTLFIDGVAVDGGYLDIDLENYKVSEIEDSFWSSGIEFNLNTTVAYHLPVTFTLGLYYGFTEKAGGGFIPFISLGYTGHGGVDQQQKIHRR